MVIVFILQMNSSLSAEVPQGIGLRGSLRRAIESDLEVDDGEDDIPEVYNDVFDPTSWLLRPMRTSHSVLVEVEMILQSWSTQNPSQMTVDTEEEKNSSSLPRKKSRVSKKPPTRDVKSTFSIGCHELLVFIGIIIYTGSTSLSNIDEYWATDSRVSQVANFMSSKRFRLIKSLLHFNNNDNARSSTDRFFKGLVLQQ
ncbi:uncharacterized protein LOC143026814 [Oratosquilla oratoria]|uniref:uncharacterized protein LOC143026814 n=1 Tax=Oratosquilla oratoria TaxID=337810 RepID=UPI003F76993D